MSTNEFTIEYKVDGALNLYNAMVGSAIKDILVDGVSIDETANSYARDITFVLDNGYEVSFETGKVDARDVADSVTYEGQPPLTIDLLDAEQVIGRRIKAVWVDSMTNTFYDDEVGTNKTLRLFIEYVHLPMNIFKTVSTKRDDDGPAIHVQIRR